MDSIRKLVSGNRRRFTEDNVNLDLTYITPNIIAMSYPSSGMESLYRNPIEKVAAFLNEKHTNKYWIVNTSERATYDKERFFDGRASEYHWPDHHGPPFNFLYVMAKQALEWIQADPENVIVVHCNSGKGRTGTAICAILLYMGYFESLDDCLKFFGHQRFVCGKGVSQPCQLRYLYYFEGFYKKQIKSPSVKRLRAIQFDQVPNLHAKGCSPAFDIYHCNGLQVHKIFSYSAGRDYKHKDQTVHMLLTEKQRMSFTMHGDTKIIFNHKGAFKDTMICRIMFNTAFIQNGNYICAGKMQLSPEDIRKDKGKILAKEFKIYIFFDEFCQNCNPYRTEIEDLCPMCKEELGPEIIDQWRQCKQICDNHFFPTVEQGRKMLPGVPQSRIDELVQTKLQFNPDYYRIIDLEQLTQQDEETKDQLFNYPVNLTRRVTQQKLQFPVTEGAFSNHLLADADDEKNDFSDDMPSDTDEIDSWLKAKNVVTQPNRNAIDPRIGLKMTHSDDSQIIQGLGPTLPQQEQSEQPQIQEEDKINIE